MTKFVLDEEQDQKLQDLAANLATEMLDFIDERMADTASDMACEFFAHELTNEEIESDDEQVVIMAEEFVEDMLWTKVAAELKRLRVSVQFVPPEEE